MEAQWDYSGSGLEPSEVSGEAIVACLHSLSRQRGHVAAGRAREGYRGRGETADLG